jgi:predicted membrane channel-forming protein YqfA (hemolysin III family)
MYGSALSCWTMLHFGAALTFFLAAQFVMVAGVVFPAAPLSAPATLATVHLLTIGWLTVLMLGALHQFVPVMTAQGARPGRARSSA